MPPQNSSGRRGRPPPPLHACPIYLGWEQGTPGGWRCAGHPKVNPLPLTTPRWARGQTPEGPGCVHYKLEMHSSPGGKDRAKAVVCRRGSAKAMWALATRQSPDRPNRPPSERASSCGHGKTDNCRFLPTTYCPTPDLRPHVRSPGSTPCTASRIAVNDSRHV